MKVLIVVDMEGVSEITSSRTPWVWNGTDDWERFGRDRVTADTAAAALALVTGDRGACDEVLALTPGVEVAAVKERLTDGTETFLPLAEAGELIARRARVAAGRWGDFVPLTFGQPVRLEVRLARPEMTEFEVPPYMERVDDRTVAAWAPSAHSAVSLYYDGFQPLYMPCVNRLQEQEGPR